MLLFKNETEAAFWRDVYLQELSAHEGSRAVNEADAAVQRLRLRTAQSDTSTVDVRLEYVPPGRVAFASDGTLVQMPSGEVEPFTLDRAIALVRDAWADAREAEDAGDLFDIVKGLAKQVGVYEG
jgi:hypothetical protein